QASSLSYFRPAISNLAIRFPTRSATCAVGSLTFLSDQALPITNGGSTSLRQFQTLQVSPAHCTARGRTRDTRSTVSRGIHARQILAGSHQHWPACHPFRALIERAP